MFSISWSAYVVHVGLPHEMRYFWAHPTLDINLGHRETSAGQALHQGHVELVQDPTASVVDRQCCEVFKPFVCHNISRSTHSSC